MDDDIGSGGTAAVCLIRGTPLTEALDTVDPRAWTALDVGVRQILRYGHALLPDEDRTAVLRSGASSDAALRTEASSRQSATGRFRRWVTARFHHPVGRVEPAAELGHLSYSQPEADKTWDESARQGAQARLALALCHPDGRVREAALEGAVEHPVLLPLLAIRAGDWATPVRERARRLLGERLDVETAVALAPLILRVGLRERGAFGLELLDSTLRRAPRERLLPLHTHTDRTVRRFAFRLSIEEGLLSPGELARRAAWDDDAVVQGLCADAALAAMTDGGDWDEVLEPLLDARSPRARSAGVTALRRAERPGWAMEFLNDRSALVRACARYVIRQNGRDPLPWYRERCADPADSTMPPGAVIGLAECGARVDAELLWPLLTHPAPTVRARTVAGLRTLDATDVARLLPLLDDPAPGVVRETATALLPFAGTLPAGLLTVRLGAARPRPVRVAAFRLLNARGGIVGLRAAVALLDDPDDKLRAWAGQSVQRWHPGADTPRGDAEVGELLNRSRHLFSDHVLQRRKWEVGLSS
ncbi:HEAT repeat domain-containing protein [Streptomyces sp. NPDC014676]|uniref:HEAT repeat domain-containing protein n=1 Tax=Streptomyces sp. NPDC014676 TaxID=3364879 RepID=UPI003700A52D